jgi:hypothetical protein
MSPNLCRHAFVACLAVIAASASADPGKFGPGLDDFRHYDGPKLTGQVLRRCVALDTESRALAGKVQQGDQDLEAAEHHFKRLGEELDHDLVALDHTDTDAVERYNQRVMRHEALVKDYNARLPAHTALVERHNAVIDRFNAACVGRAYLRSEWIEAQVSQDDPQ